MSKIIIIVNSKRNGILSENKYFKHKSLFLLIQSLTFNKILLTKEWMIPLASLSFLSPSNPTLPWIFLLEGVGLSLAFLKNIVCVSAIVHILWTLCCEWCVSANVFALRQSFKGDLVQVMPRNHLWFATGRIYSARKTGLDVLKKG